LHDFQAVAALAGRQHGAVTRAQLRDLGLTRHQVDDAAATARLHRIHQGVYLVGHTALAPLAREHAALLACGGAALLSHRTAAALWQLRPQPPSVEVTVVGHHVRQREGIRMHQVQSIDRADLTSRQGLKVTAPARTLIDLAAVVESDELEAALSEAYALRRITEPELVDALERNRGRPGAAALRTLLATQEGPTITKSRGERLLRALLRKAELPQPLSNQHLLGHRPDLLWPEHRLIVEFDGFQWHGHRAKFESDRARDAIFVAHGYRVIRVTWPQLIKHPYRVIANLARALAVA
jgi:very-short-patch-repair endonuclease/predicted transcriptional regulator of viral defense system